MAGTQCSEILRGFPVALRTGLDFQEARAGSSRRRFRRSFTLELGTRMVGKVRASEIQLEKEPASETSRMEKLSFCVRRHRGRQFEAARLKFRLWELASRFAKRDPRFQKLGLRNFGIARSLRSSSVRSFQARFFCFKSVRTRAVRTGIFSVRGVLSELAFLSAVWSPSHSVSEAPEFRAGSPECG